VQDALLSVRHQMFTQLQVLLEDRAQLKLRLAELLSMPPDWEHPPGGALWQTLEDWQEERRADLAATLDGLKRNLRRERTMYLEMHHELIVHRVRDTGYWRNWVTRPAVLTLPRGSQHPVTINVTADAAPRFDGYCHTLIINAALRVCTDFCRASVRCMLPCMWSLAVLAHA
jgi:hypothetical protein